jgi:hypothetical protein
VQLAPPVQGKCMLLAGAWQQDRQCLPPPSMEMAAAPTMNAPAGWLCHRHSMLSRITYDGHGWTRSSTGEGVLRCTCHAGCAALVLALAAVLLPLVSVAGATGTQCSLTAPGHRLSTARTGAYAKHTQCRGSDPGGVTLS